MVGLWPNLGATLELLEFAEANAVASVTATGGLCTRLLPHARLVLRGLGWKLDDVDLGWPVARNLEATVVLMPVRLVPRARKREWGPDESDAPNKLPLPLRQLIFSDVGDQFFLCMRRCVGGIRLDRHGTVLGEQVT